MPIKLKSILLLLVMTTSLAACGFQLRGKVNIPLWLNPIHISAANPYSKLATEIRRQLSKNEITTVRKATDSEYTLRIINVIENKRTLAVDSTIDASEFRYEIAMVYELVGPGGQFLVGPDERISSGRNYQQSSNELAAEAGQVSQLREEIYRSLALQVSWRLQALKQPVKIDDETLQLKAETLDLDP